MVDHKKGSGTSATLIIRDNGDTVTFILVNTSSQTYIGTAHWSGRINGVNVGGTYSMSGAQTKTLGSWRVYSSQTVAFAIAATGTQGLGGPTSFSAYVSRGTVTPAPTNYGFSLITHTSLRQTFRNNGDGGRPTLEWQTRFGTDGSSILSPQNAFYSSSGTLDISGLIPGQYYACWSRGRNSLGWGPWSSGKSGYTLSGVEIKDGDEWKNAVPYIKVNGVWKPSEPYYKDGEVWKKTRN